MDATWLRCGLSVMVATVVSRSPASSASTWRWNNATMVCCSADKVIIPGSQKRRTPGSRLPGVRSMLAACRRRLAMCFLKDLRLSERADQDRADKQEDCANHNDVELQSNVHEGAPW